MTTSPPAPTDYAARLSQRVAAERHALARRWLGRLNDLLTVEPNEVFPSEQLLDHIPTLIGEIAAYLRAPADQEIAANTVVIEKARELGTLRTSSARRSISSSESTRFSPTSSRHSSTKRPSAWTSSRPRASASSCSAG
jgi:hypothetical protein